MKCLKLWIFPIEIIIYNFYSCITIPHSVLFSVQVMNGKFTIVPGSSGSLDHPTVLHSQHDHVGDSIDCNIYKQLRRKQPDATSPRIKLRFDIFHLWVPIAYILQYYNNWTNHSNHFWGILGVPLYTARIYVFIHFTPCTIGLNVRGLIQTFRCLPTYKYNN